MFGRLDQRRRLEQRLRQDSAASVVTEEIRQLQQLQLEQRRQKQYSVASVTSQIQLLQQQASAGPSVDDGDDRTRFMVSNR